MYVSHFKVLVYPKKYGYTLYIIDKNLEKVKLGRCNRLFKQKASVNNLTKHSLYVRS